jgi:hypothetical protein
MFPCSGLSVRCTFAWVFSSSLHVICKPTISSVFGDVLHCLTKLHAPTLTSFIYHAIPLTWSDGPGIHASQSRITIDTLQPLLNCQNLVQLEIGGTIEVRLLPDDIQRICHSLSKLQSFRVATDITDEDGESLLTITDLQPFSRLPDLGYLLIQFDGSSITTDESRDIPASTSKLQYLDVGISDPPTSARDVTSTLKRMFPQLESLSYDTDNDSTDSELSDNDLFDDKQESKGNWDKVSTMLKRKRKN